ncbi:hydratase [Eggerthia catenaformis]|uniref:hydratase n=1 Tax=Eggerthia catenaformis TaxID=31973 RepID=UPI0028EF4AA0|nr:hydratase [Eggerthia catenaformis]
MIKLYNEGIFLKDGYTIIPESQSHYDKNEAKKGTIAYHIMNSHNISNNMEHLRIKFDSMASHDITYVGIIQTARASGMKKFPLPYVMTCCHNSLCAVGGTINDDDHLFGLSAAKKYGGIYVPPHIAVIHQYMRENFAGCGKMILGSDSHTRYGALGTMAIGEGGGELVKQLLEDTYDIDLPDVIAVYLDGKPHPWVGPHDIALAIIREVFKNGYVKNKVMEFVGPGISTIDTDYRNGIDVMTTETTCLSSIWRTDEDTHDYLKKHHREADYRTLNPASIAYYEGCVYVDLSTIKPMIALPFHPSHAYEIDELYENLIPILKETEEAATKISEGKTHFTLLDKVTSDGKLMVQQGVIGGCSGGTYSNIVEAAHALKGKTIGNDEFYLSIYPSSQPVYTDLDRKGFLADLMDSGALIRSAFCGPCFGAGDIPANNAISIRHNTRNFPNREGSKPGQGQMSAVALMDARSIAATAVNGGILTSAEHLDIWGDIPEYHYNDRSYQSRVYNGFNHPDNTKELRYGPNIKDWPKLGALTDHILLKIASKIEDEVTTTDELIPSGETSSYRSNPLGLAEFTLSRRDPLYVQRSKSIRDLEQQRCLGHTSKSLENIFNTIKSIKGFEALNPLEVEIGSVLYANKPGDGSAREQAASCQRVLGGLANITQEYATKRYRSNCINWGILPFHLKGQPDNLKISDYIFVPNIKEKLANSLDNIPAYIIRENSYIPISLYILDMTDNEKEILKAGSLINYNRNKQ